MRTLPRAENYSVSHLRFPRATRERLRAPLWRAIRRKGSQYPPLSDNTTLRSDYTAKRSASGGRAGWVEAAQPLPPKCHSLTRGNGGIWGSGDRHAGDAKYAGGFFCCHLGARALPGEALTVHSTPSPPHPPPISDIGQVTGGMATAAPCIVHISFLLLLHTIRTSTLGPVSPCSMSLLGTQRGAEKWQPLPKSQHLDRHSRYALRPEPLQSPA